jgi:hypothetical protein
MRRATVTATTPLTIRLDGTANDIAGVSALTSTYTPVSVALTVSSTPSTQVVPLAPAPLTVGTRVLVAEVGAARNDWVIMGRLA